MFKYFLVFAMGLAAGYTYGFDDAKKHDDSIVTRTVDRIGGDARKQYGNDVDGEMDRLEKR